MKICEKYEGEIRDYEGLCCVLVTDAEISEAEYYYLKGEFLARGYELVSTRYTDEKLFSEYLIYANSRKKKSGGKKSAIDGKIIQNILKLRDEGKTLRGIREHESVRHPDGRKLSISTIQNIIKKGEKK
jgi:hypothetical protein